MDFRTHVKKTITPRLRQDLGLKNNLAVPTLEKIKVAVGIGSSVAANKDYSLFVDTVTAITGQRPIVHRARKAISNFKVKEGMPVGLTVTLRGKRMYDFFHKLVNVVLPRVRDFQGISKKSFDGRGNLSMGLKEHTVFLEINPDDVVRLHGIQVTICTTAENDAVATQLLRALGFPFQKQATS